MKDSQPSFSRARKWSISFNVLISTLIVLAIILMLNFLAARHYWRLPLSFHAQTELSPMTHRVLNSITNPVKVVVFFEKQEPMFDSVWSLLKEYRFACPKLTVEAVDYLASPGAAQEIQNKYKLRPLADKDLVIFECQGRTRMIAASELSELDTSALMSGQSKEVKRTHFKGEMMFTSAILTVTNPRQLRACYLQGHGEHSLEADDKTFGYSKFKEVLRDNNIEVQTLRLDAASEIPDCQVLVIAGPRDPFLPEEIGKIDRYLRQGGRLWVMFNHMGVQRALGLEKMLEAWGVEVGRNVVTDVEHSITRSDMVVSQFGGHPITKPLIDSSLYMVYPRSVAKVKTTGPSDGVQVELLATTGEKGRVMSDIRNGEVYPSAQDYVGTVPIMAAVEKGGLRGVSADRGATRLVVAGDSVFMANNAIEQVANRQFANLALNWLLARNEILGELGPRPIKEYRLIVTKSQMNNLRWGLLAGMPGAVLMLGGIVRFRRRH
ncbi:MAG TPA: GldG family protein [Verrucomicrobiae bacterium]|nr:GldG family protein [Verrucomicrobiae bacterium]